MSDTLVMAPSKLETQCLPECHITEIPSENALWVQALFGDKFHGSLIHQPFPREELDSVCYGRIASTPQKEKSTDILSNSVGLDLTGSPLKAAFEVNGVGSPLDDSVFASPHNFLQNFQAGYPINVARKLVYERHQMHTKDESPMHWCLCDQKDRRKTWLLGLGYQENILQRHAVTQSPVPVPQEHLSLITFLKQHQQQAPGLKTHNSVIATYKANMEEDDSSTVELECSWSGCKGILDKPPLTANISVCVRINCADKHSLIHTMYDDLVILTNLFNGVNTNEVIWASHLQEGFSVAQELEKFLGNLRYFIVGKKQKAEKQDDEIDEAQKQAFLLTRDQLDFTDYLWDILKYCCSYKELSDCLTKVFTALENGQIRPQISPRDTCCMAKLAMKVMRERSEMPTLEGKQPINLLIGMGIQKLKKDYLFTYNEAKIAGIHELKELPMDKIGGLWALHQGLQCASLCYTSLKLPTEVLVSPVRNLLRKLQPVQPEAPFVYNFRISTSHVQEVLEDLDASMWVLKLYSEGRNDNGETAVKVTNTHLLTIAQPDRFFGVFPNSDPSSGIRKDRASSTDCEQSPTYYVSSLCSIEERL